MRPLQFLQSDDETWPEYVARVRPLVPNIPDDVFDQWQLANLHRMPQFDPSSLAFRQVSVSNAKIHLVTHWNETGVGYEVMKFMDGSYGTEHGLLSYMLAHGTWPTPPVAVDRSVTAMKPEAKYLVLEGMHRLGFLRGMKLGRHSLANHHLLWVGRVIPRPAAN